MTAPALTPTPTTKRFRALAARMIAKFGALVTVRGVRKGTHNQATGTTTGPAQLSMTVMAAREKYSANMGMSQGLSFEQAAVLMTEGVVFKIAAETAGGDDIPFAPEPGMTITGAAGQTYTILGVAKDAPDDVPIAYLCACKVGG